MLQGDGDALHFGAFHKADLIGVASFFPEGRDCQLRKLAVAHRFRRRQVATRLLESGFADLRRQAITRVWCDARVSARAFYDRHGFDLGTDVFQKSGLDYVIASRFI